MKVIGVPGARRTLGALRDATHRQPHADLAIALVVFAATALTTAAGAPDHRWNAGTVVSVAISCGALVVRRRWPYLAFAVSASAAEAYLVQYRGQQGSMVLAAPLVALYTAAELSSRRRALAIGGVAVVVLGGVHMLHQPSARLGADNLALAALGALAVAAGDAARSRRDYLAEVKAAAERADHEREVEAARRITEDRLRIARDLHDVVGHQLAVINVQAGVAAHVLDAQPGKAREALTHVRTASKAALDELRTTIGLLRQPDEQAAPTEPAIGLAGLAGLLTTFRQAGLSIQERVEGPARPVAVAADLTAYRVIQESLTNVCKHAGPTTVVVRLRYQPAAFQIIVENAAPPEHPPAASHAPPSGTSHAPPSGNRGGAGHGIVGMRERVTALGGTLTAGTRPDGGYRVTATLPHAPQDHPHESRTHPHESRTQPHESRTQPQERRA